MSNVSISDVVLVGCLREALVKQIVFEGERFDVMSVRQWRERVLGQ